MQARRRWVRSLCASRLADPLAFFAGTWLLVSVVRVHATVHLDTARDLLLARDCVVNDACGAGPASSFGGWTQGALWSHVLELREALGLGLGALEEVVRLDLALAAAFIPLAARTLGRTANALTWALWFPATLLTIGYPTLWNPTLLPLALAVFCLALLRAGRTGSTVACVAAGVTLALAVDLHVVSALLLPVLVAAVFACSTRPLVAAPTAAISVGVVLGVSSPGAFAANWPLVVGQAPLVGVGLMLAAVGGAVVRRRMSRLDGPARATAAAAGLCIFTLCLLPLLALVVDHPLHPRYLAPVVAPAAILVSTRSTGALPRAWVRVVGLVVAIAGYLAFAVGEHVLNPHFRLTEVEAVADALYGRGAAYGDLYRRLRGPDAHHLLATLAVLEPRDLPRPAADDVDLLVLRVERRSLPRELPAHWLVVELGTWHAAVVVPYAPWLRLDPLEVCQADTCMRVDLNELDARPLARWADRSYPSLPGLRRPAPGERVDYRMQLRAHAGGPARLIRLFMDRCEGWRVEVDGQRDTSVRVAADGEIHDVTFSVVAGSGCRWWLPPFVEVPEGSVTAALVAAER